MSTNRLYYRPTEGQFKHTFAVSKEESANFSIIHFNCRSLPSNYNKLKDSINALDFQFDVIIIINSFIFIQIIEYIVMSINTQFYNVQLHIIYICIHLGLPIARLQYFHNLLDIIPIEWTFMGLTEANINQAESLGTLPMLIGWNGLLLVDTSATDRPVAKHPFSIVFPTLTASLLSVQ